MYDMETACFIELSKEAKLFWCTKWRLFAFIELSKEAKPS